MKSMKIAAVVAGVFAATAVHAQALIKIDGSSTVFPVTEAVAEDFQKAKKGSVRVTVGISGTGHRRSCKFQRRLNKNDDGYEPRPRLNVAWKNRVGSGPGSTGVPH